MYKKTKLALIVSLGSLCYIYLVVTYWYIAVGGVPFEGVMAALCLPLFLIPATIEYLFDFNKPKLALLVSLGSLCCICLVPIYWYVKAGSVEWIVPSAWIMIALGIPLSVIPVAMEYLFDFSNFYVYFFICILQYQIIAFLTWKLGRKRRHGD